MKIKLIIVFLLLLVIFSSRPARAGDDGSFHTYQYVDVIYVTRDWGPTAYKFTDQDENRVCYVAGTTLQCFDKK